MEAALPMDDVDGRARNSVGHPGSQSCDAGMVAVCDTRFESRLDGQRLLAHDDTPGSEHDNRTEDSGTKPLDTF